jgi:pimeloyl-ACP methyl ester carboxylesterase
VVLPELLDRIGARKPILVGHSDGASIALIHAGNRTVGGVVLLAPHVFVEEFTLAAIRETRERYRTGDLRERMVRHHDDPDATFSGGVSLARSGIPYLDDRERGRRHHGARTADPGLGRSLRVARSDRSDRGARPPPGGARRPARRAQRAPRAFGRRRRRGGRVRAAPGMTDGHPAPSTRARRSPRAPPRRRARSHRTG